MKKNLNVLLTCFLALFAGVAIGANIDVSQSSFCTINNAYDRNPSIMFDGGNYWLFYTKGDNVSTDGVRGPTYNPDGDTYVVYYKTASTIDGLTGASEIKLALSESSRPAGFDQRVVSATAFDGKVYAFVSSGQSGTDRGLYYYENSGGSWSGPVTLIADATARGGHINVTSDNSYVYIVWESSDGSSDCYTWNGTTLSSKIDISGGNQPKITYYLSGKSGNLFVVNIEDGTGDIEVFLALASPNPLFSPHSTAIPGGGFYDPCIFTDDIDLYVVSAPYVAVDRQYLIQTKFDVATSTWSNSKVVSYGGYGATEWWDYWPCGFHDGSDAYVFFTTETNSPVFSDGEIAYIKMDWDLGNDHYFYIQNAVDQAVSGDEINIYPGSYLEQVVVSTDNLTLTGSGNGTDPLTSTIIKSPETLTYYFTTGTNNNYPVLGIDGVSSCSIQNLTVDGDNQGDSNYRFDGVAFWNAGGTVSNVDVLNIMNSTFSGAQHGVGIYSYNITGGPYNITLDDVLIDDFQKNAVALLGNGLTYDIDDVTCIGQGPTDVTAQNGIQVGNGASGTVDNCTITGVNWTGGTWTASGFMPAGGNFDANGVILDQCQTSVYAQDASGIFENGIITNPAGDGFYAYNSSSTLANIPRLLPQPIDADLNQNISLTVMDVELINSTIIGVNAEFSWGVGAFSTSADPVNLTVTGCAISNWDYGVYAYDYGGPVNVTASDNSITSCTYAVGSNMINVQDASGNWYGITDPEDLAMLFEGNVDYTPWLGIGDDTDPVSPGFQGDFSILWVDDSSPQTGTAGYIEEGIDLVSGSTVNLVAGTYNETATIDKTLSLIGAGVTQTFITGGIAFNAGISDVTIQHIYITGVAASNSIIRSSGVNTNLTLDNCVVDGEEISGRLGYAGGSLEGDVTITNNEFMDVAGWSLLDSKSGSGGDGSAMGTVTFANNYIHECDGSIVFRGLSTDRTDVVNVYNNTWENIGDNFATPSQHWAAFELNHALAANIYNNDITNVTESEWGEGQGFQLWDIGTLDMYDNTITDCFQGIFVFDGELGGTYGGPYEIPTGSIYHNSITGFSDYAMSVGANCTGTSLNAEQNYWGSVNCQEFSGSILGDVDFEPYCNSTLSQCDFNCLVTEVWVDDDWIGSSEGDIVGGHVFGYNAFATIQDGIDNVIASTVHVLNGTYTETLDINKSLTLSGESEAGVIIDASSFSDYGLYASGDLTITLENFTLIGPPSPTYGYGVKISGENAIVSISHVTVQNCGRSGFDLNGITSGNLQSLTATNNGGVGLALSDCDNVTVDNLQTSGNAWAGVGIFTYGQYYTGGSDNITFTGLNSIPDLLYTQIDNYSDPFNPYPITNLTIPISLFAYTASNNLAPTYVVYFQDLTTAIAAVLGGPDPVNSFIIERATGEFYVGNGMTIQAAITAAGEGDLINVLAGTYPEVLNIATNDLSIIGAGQSDVTIDAGGLAGYNSSGIYVTGNGVTLQGFTFVGEPSAAMPRYGIKYGDIVGGSLTDVLITEFYRSGIDMLGTDGLTLSNVESTDNGGNGIQACDGRNITFNNITTDGNAWGGIGLFTYGRYTPLGVENIVFTGTNSFGETGTDNGGLYLEEGNFNDPANPEPITFSDDPLDLADVTVQLSDFVYFMRGDSDNENNYTRFYTSLSDILDALAGSPGHITTNRTMQNLMFPHNFYVYDIPGGLMTIQAAINAGAANDTINVAAGTYEEAILINKPLTLLGATAGVNKNGYTVPVDYAWDDEIESIIVYPTPGVAYNAIVDIYDIDDVTFDGFIVQELNAVGNLNTSLVRVYALTHAISNIAVINSVIGPNTNTVSQDGTHGRMGLYIVNHPYTDFGVTNSTFAHNKIFDCKGNGNNIFLWSSYYAYGAPGPASMSGTIIDDNEIYGSHRSGIETAGGFSDLTISNNTIYGNSGLPGDNPSTLKYGHGMLLIRGASDKVSNPLTAYGPVDLTVEGNQIYGNEKSGIYMGPKNDGIIFTDNTIHDNGWNGIMVDLVGNYWNPTFEDPPVSGQYACYDCSNDISASGNSIYNNGIAGNPLADFGVKVNGVPTNAFVFDAEGNWWGAYCGPYHATLNPNGEGNAVSDYVDFDPWCNDDFTICTFSVSNPAPTEVWVDDDYAMGLANDGHLWCIDAFAVIQDGVDAVADGGTVHVAAGTYPGQVVINKSLTLEGTGNPVVQPPAVLASALTVFNIEESSRNFYPMLFAYGGTDDGSGYISGTETIEFNISGFDFDGNNSATTSQFAAMLIRNCLNSEISDNDLYEIYKADGYNPETGGIMVYGNSDVTIEDNTVNDFTRVGIVLAGDNGLLTDPIGTITGNIVAGEGPAPQGYWAQNGIQVGYGATGTVSGNEVSDIAYIPTSWAATAITIVYAGDGLVISGNNIHDCEATIYANYTSDLTINGNNTITNCDFTAVLGGTGIIFDGNTVTGNYEGLYIGDATNVEITNNTFTNNEYCIVADGVASNLDFTGNTITGSSGTAFYFDDYYGDEPTDVTIRYNSISGNAYGVYNLTSVMTDAEANWWGDPSGPATTTTVAGRLQATRPQAIAIDMEPGVKDESLMQSIVSQLSGKDESVLLADGSGDAVSELVDYSPWWGGNYVHDDHSTAWSWYVDISNSSTIMEGIDFTLEGDTVFATPAIYQGTGNKNIDFGGKDIVLAASEDVDNTIIDCQLSGRALYFHNGESEAATVMGFTLKNGIISGNGGAILCENASSPTIANCLIIGNIVSGFGGGIACDGASNSTIVNCTISKNTANGQYNSGGGIYCFDSSPIVKNTIVYENYGPGQNQIYSHTMSDYEPFVTYCDVQNGWPGSGNIAIDPLFRNTDLNDPDFHLMAIACSGSYDSPCIDTGHPNIKDAILGCDNGLGTILSDMGAYGGGNEQLGLSYYPGDVNMFVSAWPPAATGPDVTYLVNYFRGFETSQSCLLDGFWCSADANGDCNVIGADVTKLVNVFRGIGNIGYCADHPPAWLTPDDFPTEAPSGWPNCETAPISSRARSLNNLGK